MTVNQDQFTFAPVGILRAAAWSIESLDQFGDATLADLALASTSVNTNTWQDYTETYHQVFERDRQRLWRMTAEDERFMKALLFSNPIVSAKVRQFLPFNPKNSRTKTIRRLENTLYRYLARAAGRTTPNGLWAGTGLVHFSETARNESTTSTYSFSPDLRAFQTILRCLARQSEYRASTHWRVNPTLRQQADGRWRFWARTQDGQVERREIQTATIVDILLQELLQLAPGTFMQLVETIHGSLPWRTITDNNWKSRSALQSILDVLAEGGVLLGGLDLPTQFATVWDALSVAGEQLNSEHQRIWQEVVGNLHCLCNHLEANFELMTLEALEERLQAATTYIVELAQALSVVLKKLPDSILHCDLNLPVYLTLNQAQRQALLLALESYDCCWLQGISFTAALRHRQRQQLAKQLEHDLALGDIEADLQAAWFFPADGAELSADHDSEVISRLKAWEFLLLQAEPEIVMEIPSNRQTASSTAPFGCLYVSPFAEFELVVHRIDDDPARAFARFPGINTNSCLHTWFQKSLQHLATSCQLIIAELQSPFEVNPNVLARSSFGVLPINLWNGSPDTVSLTEAKISLDPITKLPFLKLPSLPKPLAVFCFSSANISANDPIADLLLYTGFQERPIANSPASALPVSRELNKPRFTPRIRLPGGAIMRSRRTVLNGHLLKEMAQASPLERYAQWQQLATKHGWTKLLNFQVDREPPLLMHRDSPLALEALFKSVREYTQWVIVEEVIDTPWLVDQDGYHYLAEIALPFLRSQHGWSLRAEKYRTCASV